MKRSRRSSFERSMEFIILLVHMAIMLCSLYVWSLQEIAKRPSLFSSLIGANYDVFMLLLFRPLYFIILTLGLFLIVANWERYYKNECIKLTLFSIIAILASTLTSIIIANYPIIIHRDAYLHGGVSEYVIINGRFDPLVIQREDAYTHPSAFVLYSVYSLLTGIDTVTSHILMTVLYPIFLITLLYGLTRRAHILIPLLGGIPISVLAFPTLITHTIGVTVFHRYYMSILIMLAILFLVGREHTYSVNDVATLLILIISLQFTHPMTSLFITLFMVIRCLFLILFGKAGAQRTWWNLIMIISLIALLIHITYLYPAHMIYESFKWLVNVERLFEFFEVSYPVRVNITPVYGEQELLYFTHLVRWLWRCTLVLTTALFFKALLSFRNFKLLLTRHWTSLLMSTAVVSIPLIQSFLWQTRFLPYYGLATITLVKEELGKVNEDKLFKALCITAIALSIIITPIIHYERSYLSEMWSPYSLIHALKVVCFLSNAEVFGGSRTSLYYMYFANAYKTSRMISIYDPITLVFRPDVFEIAIGKPVIVSIIDPEFNEINETLAMLGSHVIYMSGTTIIHIPS